MAMRLDLLDWEGPGRQDDVSEADLNGSRHDVTALLHEWGQGDLAARDQLMDVVYQELRRRAAARLRREKAGHILQPTALVHETYLRLVNQRHTHWSNRAQFLALASALMRRILIDVARRRMATKRSGKWAQLTLDDATVVEHPPDVEILALDAALSELASFDHRKSRIAELRFFGGLSLEEVGDALSISRATVEREWQAARAWLFRRLNGERPDDA